MTTPTPSDPPTSGFLPDSMIEADERLQPAHAVYEQVQSGQAVLARTHRGRLRRITRATRGQVAAERVGVEMDGMAYPLALAAGHPVLTLCKGNARGKTTWTSAGDLSAGDVLLEPIGPEWEHLVTNHYDPARSGKHRWTRPQSGVMTMGLLALYGIEPRTGRRFRDTDLTSEEVFCVERAFGLPGSKYAQRDSAQVMALRRRMAEHGLPQSLVGTSMNCLRPFIFHWGEDDGEGHFIIDITPDKIGRCSRPEWTGRGDYEPQSSDEEACRRAAYTLLKALSAAEAPARLETPTRLRLRNYNAALFVTTHYERRVSTRKAKRFRGPRERTVRAGKGMYVRRPVRRVTRRPPEGLAYGFHVGGEASLVASGVAVRSS